MTSATRARSRDDAPRRPVDHTGAGSEGGVGVVERGEITVGRGHGEGARRLPQHRRRRRARTRSRWCTGQSTMAATPATTTPRIHPSSRDARSASTPGDITARTKARVAAVAPAVK